MKGTLARDKHVLIADQGLGDDEAQKVLTELGLVGTGDPVSISSLSGGVSCDVLLVEVCGRRFVLKRALPKLRVKARWLAPVSRAESEVEWIKYVGHIDSRIVPQIIAQSRRRHLFVMEYLPENTFPVWKNELAAGNVDTRFAATVGSKLAEIHAATAGSRELAKRFANQRQFLKLRLDPYLLQAARANPDVALHIKHLSTLVGSARIALMHGDVSPKNILHGRLAPVFLDAETACYGDPAFDLAFCLNHLLLKGIWHPEHALRYAIAFAALKTAYIRNATWESAPKLEARTATLLAALLLARIDGKSPVEYIVDERRKAFVRTRSKRFLARAETSLDAICEEWLADVARYFTGSTTL